MLTSGGGPREPLELAALVVLDLGAEVRPRDLPAVHDRRVGVGHLQRRGLQVPWPTAVLTLSPTSTGAGRRRRSP